MIPVHIVKGSNPYIRGEEKSLSLWRDGKHLSFASNVTGEIAYWWQLRAIIGLIRDAHKYWEEAVA